VILLPAVKKQSYILLNIEEQNNMMRIALFFLLLTSFIFHSCNYEKYKHAAVSHKGTWWDIYKVNGKLFIDPVYSYFCAVNGECYYYFVEKLPDGSIRRNIVSENETKPDTWTMRSDTIQLRGNDYLIHSRMNKKLILVSLDRSNDTLELIESEIR
jgi:hypothetical protein